MKRILYFMIAAISLQSCKKNEDGEDKKWHSPLKIASYNIQYDNTVQAPASEWVNRKDLFKQMVEKYDFDIIGAQEPYLSQLNDIKSMLPGYDYIGISINGETTALKRHYTPIIYKKDKIEILDWGTFWFSSSSSEPGSIGWDAYSPRICTRALIKDKTTGKIFNFFNVPLDHIGTTARDMSVQMLLSLVPVASAKYHSIITGDFNLNQNSVNYNRIVSSGVLRDSYKMAQEKVNAEYGTYNDYVLNQNLGTRIDHIFLSTGLPLRVKKHHIITDDFNGKYPSDHYPVMIELQLPK
ncbi:endonuclease/exonuclease/phosphatase family protein [Pseudopedobacter sp.]|uniref:endonuclease/exonuclease/phosphatase family protein n=1 Tax=Pseudopedobacter sp. TaxID=1936787 RepID=UPI00333F0CC8